MKRLIPQPELMNRRGGGAWPRLGGQAGLNRFRGRGLCRAGFTLIGAMLLAVLTVFSVSDLRAEARPRVKVALLGDSLTQGGSWRAYFPECETLNFGVGGDTTAMILDRLEPLIEAGPEVVFLQAGINDFSRRLAPELILENHRLIRLRLREGLPDSRIYVQSLLPVSERKFPGWNGRIKEFNRRLKVQAEKDGFEFIDIYFLLADGEGQLRPDFTYDGLHLTAPAYERWSDRLKPGLRPGTPGLAAPSAGLKEER